MSKLHLHNEFLFCSFCTVCINLLFRVQLTKTIRKVMNLANLSSKNDQSR